MSKPVRIILAVVAGWFLYGTLWNVTGMTLASVFPDSFSLQEATSDMTLLIVYLLISIPISVLCGYVAARIGNAHAGTAVKALAIVNLVTGIAVQVMAWDLLPAWWHIAFLVFIVPATMYGGGLFKPSAS